MNELYLDSGTMPLVFAADSLAATTPFYHADRVADFSVMIYVTAGKISVTEDEIDYFAEAGQLIFLKKGVHHYGKYEIPTGTKWRYVHFLCDGAEVEIPKKLSGLENTALEASIFSFVEGFSDGERGRFEAGARLFLLLAEIARYESAETKTLSARITAYLSENLAAPFSAAELERHFSFSYKYMAAVFKSETGGTMGRRHAELRMREACRLLRSTSLSVGEIAQRLGFSDMLYFSKSFGKIIGECPTAYRKSIQKSF